MNTGNSKPTNCKVIDQLIFGIVFLGSPEMSERVLVRIQFGPFVNRYRPTHIDVTTGNIFVVFASFRVVFSSVACISNRDFSVCSQVRCAIFFNFLQTPSETNTNLYDYDSPSTDWYTPQS